MEFSYEDDPFGLDCHDYEWTATEQALELAFDDEPLEAILYGEGEKGPTAANLYLPVQRRLDRIRDAWNEARVEDALQELAAFGMEGLQLSLKTCRLILRMINKVLPDHPRPVLQHDLSNHGELLERIWRQALAQGNLVIQVSCGPVLQRWFEQYHRYSDARDVIRRLIEICQQEDDLPSQMGAINNYGFSYLLEEKWSEALPYFEKAAATFEKEGIRSRYANSRANYWTCRWEIGVEDLDEVKSELKELAEILEGARFWQRRKVMILQAKIAERRGRVSEAIALVRQAVEVTRGHGSAYTAVDEEYLERLQRLVGGESDPVCESDGA